MSKVKQPLIDLTGYRFFNAIPALEIIPPYALTSPIRRLDTKKKWNPNPNITELSHLLDLDLKNPTLTVALKTHQRRVGVYYVLSGLLTSILYFSMGLLTLFLIFGAIFLTDLKNTRIPLPADLTSRIIFASIFVMFYIAFRLADRVTTIWVDRFFADTLAYSVCLKLLIHLYKDNVLILAGDRQHLLLRIRALRRYLILLPYQYGLTEDGPQQGALAQFKYMERFALEKENEILIPQKGTQMKLIADMHALLPILLTSQYGEFELARLYETAGTDIGQPTPQRSRILRLLGILGPVVLLAMNFFFKPQVQALGLDNQIVALIGLAWFLLALDANLNLGMVDRVSGLAKAMRELR